MFQNPLPYHFMEFCFEELNHKIRPNTLSLKMPKENSFFPNSPAYVDLEQCSQTSWSYEDFKWRTDHIYLKTKNVCFQINFPPHHCSTPSFCRRDKLTTAQDRNEESSGNVCSRTTKTDNIKLQSTRTQLDDPSLANFFLLPDSILHLSHHFNHKSSKYIHSKNVGF